jgi:hypothetical protein
MMTYEDVNADKCDGGALGSEIAGACYGSCDGDDELTDCHSDCAHQEQITAAHLFDEVEAREGGDDVDGARITSALATTVRIADYRLRNNLDDERILEPSSLEITSAIVEDEVLDDCQHQLQCHLDNGRHIRHQ